MQYMSNYTNLNLKYTLDNFRYSHQLGSLRNKDHTYKQLPFVTPSEHRSFI